MHRTVEINACTAMVHASPPRVRQTGKQECSKQGRGGNPTSNSSWILAAISSLSAPHRKAQWPSQIALELVLQIMQHTAVGTEPSRVFGMGVGFATHLASQHTRWNHPIINLLEFSGLPLFSRQTKGEFVSLHQEIIGHYLTW